MTAKFPQHVNPAAGADLPRDRKMDDPLEPWEAALLDGLNSANTESAVEAAHELRSLTPGQTVRLVQAASLLHKPPLQRIGRFAALPLLAAAYAVVRARPEALTGLVIVILVGAGAALALFALLDPQILRPPEITRCCAALALHIESRFGADAVANLLDLLHEDQEMRLPLQLRRSAQTALRRALADMTENTYSALESKQRAWLACLITSPQADIGLRIAVVETVARFADPLDNELRVLLNGYVRESPITANMQSLHQAAAQALALLNERQEVHARGRTLLRAADRPVDPRDDILLRPGLDAGQSAPGEMVRAASAPEPE